MITIHHSSDSFYNQEVYFSQESELHVPDTWYLFVYSMNTLACLLSQILISGLHCKLQLAHECYAASTHSTRHNIIVYCLLSIVYCLLSIVY